MNTATAPTAVVVMGVAGAGKTTVGERLARRLGWAFMDGDQLHPPANLDKLRRGIALDDADRWDWLRALAAWIDGLRRMHGHGVIACSALKRRYRELLVGGHGDVRLVYLKAPPALVAARVAARTGHVMPARLLGSQFDALEEPGADEQPIVVAVEAAPEVIVEQIVRALAPA